MYYPYDTAINNCCGCPKDVLIVLGFSCPSLSPSVVCYVCFLVRTAVLFCLLHLRGGTTPLIVITSFVPGIYIYFSMYIFTCFFVPSVFLCQRIWIASICMPYLSHPVRRHVIPFSTLLTTLLIACSISAVSWFCDHRACISPGGRITKLQSLYHSRRKNRHGHWVCWLSTGRKKGLM